LSKNELGAFLMKESEKNSGSTIAKAPGFFECMEIKDELDKLVPKREIVIMHSAIFTQ